MSVLECNHLHFFQSFFAPAHVVCISEFAADCKSGNSKHAKLFLRLILVCLMDIVNQIKCLDMRIDANNKPTRLLPLPLPAKLQSHTSCI